MLMSFPRLDAPLNAVLDRLLGTVELGREEALQLYSDAETPLETLAAAARELRQRGKGSTITYSPKVFLPLTIFY